ncbi:MAG TPA: regulatory iron-sulfur-containing complex subunit RicT [Bacteroidales bacterium]|nr:regulatory iron-sulfur-containing complex subunit RicT [Bacteroidales bacterium]HSA43170.1 regulatory iron-sulfur-containing complex subunit RicT [Bacteroidales bacterium]
MEDYPEERRKTNHAYHQFFTRACCHDPKPYQNNAKVFSKRCAKMDATDWLKDYPITIDEAGYYYVEIRFKNNRKEIFKASSDQEYTAGDIVAVEASPGHDIGIVSMVGETVRLQMKRKGIKFPSDDIKKVYRKARATDIEKWVAAVEHEDKATLKTRGIAEKLRLVMKVNDVEYQGDNTKAIFYYTADERVDFRELIKILADEFRVRIEMKQIGVRQEASRLGGIGTCGRELCCASWMSCFKSVGTHSARVQQLSLNPQKLAGQCGKLKCCLNYEYATYLDAMKGFPDVEMKLRTKKGDAVHQKTDIFRKIMWYSYQHDPNHYLAIPLEAVLNIIENNKKGVFPENLEDFASKKEVKTEMDTLLTQDDLTRFDE